MVAPKGASLVCALVNVNAATCCTTATTVFDGWLVTVEASVPRPPKPGVAATAGTV